MDKDIKDMRMNFGRFLHSYYVNFGDQKYEEFLRKISPKMVKDYGESFSVNNLRIMEAEFVMFNKKIKKNDAKDSENPNRK